MNASGYGEGRYVLGSATVMTDASGNASFVFSVPDPCGGAQFVTATATDPGGNTSEFSQAFGIDIPPTAVIGFTNLTVNEGVAVPFDGLGSTRPQRRSAHLYLVVRRRRDGDGRPSRPTPTRHRGSIP